eukprot:TRINITY_DN3761_c0_g1_i2.p3 TRINITY_DN3761_c0_g1~~TRINITY_DN3761_c0_g1_i2.p3  ORF type:complete len:125 (-),score=18.38 TRINITY_DN3761_c0_g1_i2:99-473(-)
MQVSGAALMDVTFPCGGGVGAPLTLLPTQTGGGVCTALIARAVCGTRIAALEGCGRAHMLDEWRSATPNTCTAATPSAVARTCCCPQKTVTSHRHAAAHAACGGTHTCCHSSETAAAHSCIALQ